jgi:hypothetical protein
MSKPKVYKGPVLGGKKTNEKKRQRKKNGENDNKRERLFYYYYYYYSIAKAKISTFVVLCINLQDESDIFMIFPSFFFFLFFHS